MPAGFHYFALNYLDDWIGYDRGFVDSLAPDQTAEIRLATLCSAAQYYRVVRNLRILPDEARLAAALSALDAIGPVIDAANVDAAIDRLATALHTSYGRYAVSAASKLLWLRYRSPVVILDSQAARTLRASGGKFPPSDYPAYRRVWLAHYAVLRPAIEIACADLPAVRSFARPNALTNAALTALTASPWFHERVFDKYLWWYAGPTDRRIEG